MPGQRHGRRPAGRWTYSVTSLPSRPRITSTRPFDAVDRRAARRRRAPNSASKPSSAAVDVLEQLLERRARRRRGGGRRVGRARTAPSPRSSAGRRADRRAAPCPGDPSRPGSIGELVVAILEPPGDRRDQPTVPRRAANVAGLHPVSVDVVASAGAARAGVATTARGTYRTPCFMPVGTRGAVKYLSAADYDRARRRDRPRQHVPPDAAPGRRDASPASAGSDRFSGWDGLTLTDSGGFQVFSLEPKVDDDGVTFRSVYDGSTHRLTPGVGGRHAGAARRRHPDGARRLPAAAEPARRRASWPLERTEAWAARARARPPPRRPVAVRHRPGRHRPRRCGRASARRDASSSTSTATASAGCRVGETARRDAAGARRGDRRTCRPTGRAT